MNYRTKTYSILQPNTLLAICAHISISTHVPSYRGCYTEYDPRGGVHPTSISSICKAHAHTAIKFHVPGHLEEVPPEPQLSAMWSTPKLPITCTLSVSSSQWGAILSKNAFCGIPYWAISADFYRNIGICGLSLLGNVWQYVLQYIICVLFWSFVSPVSRLAELSIPQTPSKISSFFLIVRVVFGRTSNILMVSFENLLVRPNQWLCASLSIAGKNR